MSEETRAANITRYDPADGASDRYYGRMAQRDDGDFVRYEDHAAALATERQRAERAEQIVRDVHQVLCERWPAKWAQDANPPRMAAHLIDSLRRARTEAETERDNMADELRSAHKVNDLLRAERDRLAELATEHANTMAHERLQRRDAEAARDRLADYVETQKAQMAVAKELNQRLAAEVVRLKGLLANLPEVLCNVSQLLDGWHQDGTAWTEWDEEVRREVVTLETSIDAWLKAQEGK